MGLPYGILGEGRSHGTAPTGLRETELFTEVGEAVGVGDAIALHRFAPHGKRAHPEAVLAIERPVDDHPFLTFAVAGKIDELVFIALKVTVTAPWREFDLFHFVFSIHFA